MSWQLLHQHGSLAPANVRKEIATVGGADGGAGAGSLLGGLNAHLDHLLVRVGVDGGDEGGAGGGAVFREETPGLVANAAGVA